MTIKFKEKRRKLTSIILRTLCEFFNDIDAAITAFTC